VESHLKFAEHIGVQYMTFDNEDEVVKIARCSPSAKAVIRIRTDDHAAVCAFSTKFGAPMSSVQRLLETAKSMKVTVVGVSFHVGSGNSDSSAYVGAIANARTVFNIATSLGFEMKLLDIGGGFPGEAPPLNAEGKPESLSFEEICQFIRPALAEHFPQTRVIAEPGRFFASSTHTLAMNVHSKRVLTKPNTNAKEYQYYVNDGVYHSFNCIFYDHAHPALYPLDHEEEASVHCTTIFGPTCDSLDCLLKNQPFPALDIGDWLFVPNFGAYTSAAGSKFNGFETRRIEYISSLLDYERDCN